MTASTQMQDLAQRLLTYEASSVKTSEPLESTVLRVYEKLRQGFGEFAGTAAFQSLASSALAMARSEMPRLRAAQVSANGALEGLEHGLGQGLSEFEPQTEIGNDDRAGEQWAGDEGIAVIAQLLGLLLIFLGEPITLRLLRNSWPDAAFDDESSERGKLA